MLQLLFLAAALPLATASGIAEWQKPLSKPPGAENCGRGQKSIHIGTTFTFHMNGDWRYYLTDYFPSDFHCTHGLLTPLHLDVLYDITNRIAPRAPSPFTKGPPKPPKNQQSSLMLTIPSNTETEGPLVLEPEPGWKLFHHMDSSIDILWTPTADPGRGLNVTSMHVERGVKLSADTLPVRIALHHPYIHVPRDVYEFLARIAKPEPFDMGRGMEAVDFVNCNGTAGFPNIHLNLEGGAQELVVKPAQYVLRVSKSLGGPFAGKCAFLVKRGGGGEMEIGYAALRGRSVWFDWANGRTGFTA